MLAVSHSGTQHTSLNGIFKSPAQAKIADFTDLCVRWKVLETSVTFP